MTQLVSKRELLIELDRILLAQAKRGERVERLAPSGLFKRQEPVEFIADAFMIIRAGLWSAADRTAAQLAAATETAGLHRRLQEHVPALLLRPSLASEGSVSEL